jgi:hypothetical protein
MYLVERNFSDYDYEELLQRWLFDDLEKVWELVREHRFYDLEIFEIELNGDGDTNKEKIIDYNWLDYVRQDLSVGTRIIIHNDFGYQWGQHRKDMIGQEYTVLQRRGGNRRGTIDVQVQSRDKKNIWFHDDQVKVKEE